ncbi:porin family protein [Phocaeicola plebeius]|uniref:porin family protein n=1 Tax=Phocaeicola plebeius TaxID=310297 RepID=UPI0026F24BBD|nr:porin family protein [Phocaeicola plebeius]
MKTKMLMMGCLLLGAGITHAQNVMLTPEVGMSAVQRYGAGEGWRPSVKVGFSADFQVKDFFSIESGLAYTFRGYTESNGVYSNDAAEWIDHVSHTRHFLQLPVLAKFKWSVGKDTKMFFGAGPYVGVSLKERVKNTPDYISTNFEHFGELIAMHDCPVGTNEQGYSNAFLYDKSRNFDWGAAANLGLEMKHWVVKLQYDLSLGKEASNDVVGAQYHSLTFSLGYKFHL